MRTDIREMELYFYNFKKYIKGKQIRNKIALLLAELENNLQLVISKV